MIKNFPRRAYMDFKDKACVGFIPHASKIKTLLNATPEMRRNRVN